MTEQEIQAKEIELDVMWTNIERLKLTDTFAAQIMYEKYRRIACELPPPLPPVICRPSGESVTDADSVAGGRLC